MRADASPLPKLFFGLHHWTTRFSLQSFDALMPLRSTPRLPNFTSFPPLMAPGSRRRASKTSQLSRISRTPSSRAPSRLRSNYTACSSNALQDEPVNIGSIVHSLQSSIDAVSTAQYKAWIERYLKHESVCRGAKTPAIQSAVLQWSKQNNIRSLSRNESTSAALIQALFATHINEDATAATFYIQDILLPEDLFPPRRLVEIERIFEGGHISVWNTLDALSTRVLSDTIDKYGEEPLLRICKWRNAEDVWQARASVVSLLKFVRAGTYMKEARTNCEVLIKRKERFANTAVGWCMRDIARKNEAFMVQFVEEFAEYFSLEAARNASKWCQPRERQRLLDIVKQKSCK